MDCGGDIITQLMRGERTALIFICTRLHSKIDVARAQRYVTPPGFTTNSSHVGKEMRKIRWEGKKEMQQRSFSTRIKVTVDVMNKTRPVGEGDVGRM